MYVKKYSVLALAALAVAGCATTGDGGKWTCDAPGGLRAYSYDGSDWASVTLTHALYYRSFPVVKNSEGNEATGTTVGGVPFVCKKAQ